MKILGEGKPENQNHAMIFCFSESIQTVDMNQENHLAEAFKMRNLLQARPLSRLQPADVRSPSGLRAQSTSTASAGHAVHSSRSVPICVTQPAPCEPNAA